jgi:hypothetical protein
MKDIIENNKEIAEFMGIPKCDRCANCGSYKFGTAIYYTPEEMDYQLSWDWLMPVVHKIHELTNVDDQHPLREAGDKVVELPLRCDMQEVYESVIEFINWYNANN